METLNDHYIFALIFTLIGTIALSATANAGIIRGVGLSYGEAQAGISIYRIDVLSKDYTLHKLPSNQSRLAGHLELGSAVWDGSEEEKNDTLVEIGITPVIRWKSKRFYLEVGTGPRLISSTSLEERKLSSLLQFGTLAGIGILFRHNPRVELGFRVQHVSNGDMAEPNHGIDFKFVQLRLRFKR